MFPKLLCLPEGRSIRMLKFYGYKKCSTCRKAEKSLEKLGKPFAFVDITEAPPSAAALKKILQQSGADIRKLFNTSGVQYQELKIKDKVADLSEPEILALLAGNGRLIKRPLVTDGVQSTVGFDEKAFPRIWK
jgi:arsenate reductase (glutaredoxin)